jgi:signal transduction histidine kinase
MDELATLFNTLLEKIKRLIAGMQDSLDAISHDLRTPLMRLRGIAETALRSKPNQEALQEALMDTLEESKRITSMLNTLMDISEADAGAMKLNLTEVRLLSLIEEVTDLYRYVAEEKDIRIQMACEEGIHVTVDPIRMKQVLANLLDNALKYTLPEGRVDITASPTPSEVVITVSDTGPGISSEELPKIWDRLYRGDDSRSQHGLGLGLSLVKAIVQAHKGTVAVVSESGAGSRFSITLPTAAPTTTLH